MAAKTHNTKSQSNGSFMRSSPLAVFARKLTVPEIVKVVTSDVSLTHSNEIIQQAQCYYIICMVSLIKNPGDVLQAFRIANEYLADCNEDVKRWVSDSLKEPAMTGTPNMGYAKIAFDHTFRQLRKENVDYQNAIADVLSIGGDTDTNACIAGAMIGALVGYRNLPDVWKFKVENFDSSREGIQRNDPCLDQRRVKDLVIQLFRNAPNRIEE